VENNTRVWLFRDYDDHVFQTFDDNGSELSNRQLGAYGAEISSQGSTWSWNAYHGAEEHKGLMIMGQRQLIKGTGLWLQPEPFLTLGISNESASTPLGLASYRYAMNSPLTYRDISGLNPEPVAVDDNDESLQTNTNNTPDNGNDNPSASGGTPSGTEISSKDSRVKIGGLFTSTVKLNSGTSITTASGTVKLSSSNNNKGDSSGKKSNGFTKKDFVAAFHYTSTGNSETGDSATSAGGVLGKSGDDKITFGISNDFYMSSMGAQIGFGGTMGIGIIF